MNNYNLQKVDPSNQFRSFPSKMYNEKVGHEHQHVIETGYARYKPNIFKRIEKFLGECFSQKHFYLYNDNSLSLIAEAHYISNGMLVSLKPAYENETPSPEPLSNDDLIPRLMSMDEFMEKVADAAEEETSDEEDGEEFRKKDYINPKAKFDMKIEILCDDQSLKFAQKFVKKFTSREKYHPKKERELNVLCFEESSGVYLRSFKTLEHETSIEDNYNDNFKKVNDEIIERLNNKDDNGIVLLHSDPGCGKTSYIRYLTKKIKHKKLIYMPPDLTSKLSDPSFMNFFMDYPNSILFIEDAENCLLKRETSGGMSSQAVSNMLNNSDGLLGDALKLQIVCTFNCDINLIDPALMRPGRLIAEYKFEKLNKYKAIALAKKLYGDDPVINTINSDTTLAEIYNLKNEKLTSKQKPISIGFKSY